MSAKNPMHGVGTLPFSLVYCTNQSQIKIQPSLDTVKEIVGSFSGSDRAPNIAPICASIPADLLTPSLAFLKVSAKSVNDLKRARLTC